MKVYIFSEYFPDYHERLQAMADNVEYAFESADALSLAEKG